MGCLLTACLLHYDPASCYSGARLSWSPAEPERKRVLKRGRMEYPGADPKPGRSTLEQGEAAVTRSGGPNRCGLKTARMTEGRGERPIKPGDSWFSPKSIEVEPRGFFDGGRATGWARAGEAGSNPNQTPNTARMDLGRQSLSDNVQRREGKNPEPQLRPQSAH